MAVVNLRAIEDVGAPVKQRLSRTAYQPVLAYRQGTDSTCDSEPNQYRGQD